MLVDVDPLRPEARSWYKGAQGERQVAAALTALGPAFTVFTVLHAVPVGNVSTDIDHVVVGPTGVFSINTKNHAGQDVWGGGRTFMVAGSRAPHMHRSLAEGEQASRLLSHAAGGPVLVQPLLVVASGQLRFGKKTPAVVTLRPDRIGPWISGLPRAHSDEAARYLSMLAEERGIWHIEAVVINDTLRHVQRFERLECEILESAARRRLFRSAITVAILAVPAAGVLGYWWAVAVAAMQNQL